jgi:hypothetical protein
MGLPEHAYKAPNIVVLAYVVKSIALIVMPWWASIRTRSDILTKLPIIGSRPKEGRTEATSTFFMRCTALLPLQS